MSCFPSHCVVAVPVFVTCAATHVQGWSFQGTAEAWHAGSSTKYFRPYGAGDIVSVEVDVDADTLSFFLNGECGGVAYTGIAAAAREHGLYPAVSMYNDADSFTVLGPKDGQHELQYLAGDEGGAHRTVRVRALVGCILSITAHIDRPSR
jgi:hypothetical protein